MGVAFCMNEYKYEKMDQRHQYACPWVRSLTMDVRKGRAADSGASATRKKRLVKARAVAKGYWV
jgi:hypothetical protein